MTPAVRGTKLDMQGMRDRIRAALAYKAAMVKSVVHQEALLPLHYLFGTQVALDRADFKAMIGLGDRIATSTASDLLQRGSLATDSPYGSLRFAMPSHTLRFYFPALWPEVEAVRGQAVHGGSPRRPRQ